MADENVACFDARCLNRREVLKEIVRDEGNAPFIVVFYGDARERPFEDEDAAFALGLAGLPSSGKLPVAYIDGELRGADLALALFCPMVVLSLRAMLGSGFGRPGSAAVYVAASRRLGSVNCERLLFRSTALSAVEAEQAHLASIAENVHGVCKAALGRKSTLLGVAKANLVTWPISTRSMLALVDARFSANPL